MKLACFAMFRNEAAILGPFLDQIEEFFDYALLIDHESTDGSAELVRSRAGNRIELLSLKAAGYPQSPVATLCARRIFSQVDPSFLFFLDCDEFLPFDDRAGLEAFLSRIGDCDAFTMPWRNVCPAELNGGDIFSGRFVLAAAHSTSFRKVILSRKVAACADWTVSQGYHHLVPEPATKLTVIDVDDYPLYHIPIQNQTQFHFKIAAGSLRLQREGTNLRLGQGWHWVSMAQDIMLKPPSKETLTAIALHYPDRPTDRPQPYADLDFAFPYVRSSYRETAEIQTGQILGLLRQQAHSASLDPSTSFIVTNDDGALVLSSRGARISGTCEDRVAPQLPPTLLNTFGETYTDLVEPLFNLPAKLPPTAWAGHIPFLFVLFRALRPSTYVELGVMNGTSLIAAATAAATYDLHTTLVGIDSWQGDVHSGRFDGDLAYNELKSYLATSFPSVQLERSAFADALPHYARGSIDVLHIDGAHTYDAARQDFSSWFDRVSPAGVILMHDINVYEQGFGVYRLWQEVKKHFTTIEFGHSFGLGVVLLRPEDERLRSLVALAHDGEALRSYQSLIADVARALPERMDGHARRRFEAELAAVHRSTSWRVSGPVRALGRVVRRHGAVARTAK